MCALLLFVILSCLLPVFNHLFFTSAPSHVISVQNQMIIWKVVTFFVYVMKDSLFLQLFSLQVKHAFTSSCVFFKVAVLKKKTQIVADLPTYTHTHTELFHLYTGASCGSWGEFALWPWVKRFGGLSHQPARSGWASCFLLHIHTAVTNTHTHIYKLL